MVEAGRIVVDAERFANQLAIRSQHGYEGKLGSHINPDDKIMKKIGHEDTSFRIEQNGSEHPQHQECQTALRVIRVAQHQ